MVRKLAFCAFALFALVGAWPNGGRYGPVVPGSQTVTPVSTSNTTPSIANASWRDQEITTGWFTTGELMIRRVGGSGQYGNTGLFFSVGTPTASAVRMGIVNGGVTYSTFFEQNPSSCITGWPSSGVHTFTFGVKGFNVYFKIDGAIAIDTCNVGGVSTGTSSSNPTGSMTYYEYRQGSMNVGQISAWISGGGTNTFTANYFINKYLYSAYAQSSFDPRDFGNAATSTAVRQVAAVTGSMVAASHTLTLSGPADFRVGDQVIVEIGGEAGAGARMTQGVGGTVPMLNYANQTAMNADTSQPTLQMAYLQTDGSTWRWSGSSWQNTNNQGSGPLFQTSYYGAYYIPYSLVSQVTAIGSLVGGLPTVLTLQGTANVATTNANVYMDHMLGFVPVSQNPPTYFQDSRDDNCPCDTYTNMTFTIPSGNWYLSHRVGIFEAGSNGRSGLNIYGQGASGPTQTTIYHPNGIESSFLDMQNNTNLSIHDFFQRGNVGDNKFGLNLAGGGGALSPPNPNHNWTVGNYGAGLFTNGDVSHAQQYNLSCLDLFNNCGDVSGTGSTIMNSTAQMDTIQRDYTEWQFEMTNCTGGGIYNSTLIGKYSLQGFEFFACNGASIVNSGGTNAMYSTNSSTSWTIDFQSAVDIITDNAYGTHGSHGIDDAIINVNNNAFPSGGGCCGLINNPNIIIQNYVTNSTNISDAPGFNDDWKFIHIQGGTNNGQHDTTIQGHFPAAGCASTTAGYMQAPNFDAASSEYGPVILSDAPNTTVTGVRIVGTAITNPGHNGHIGNISLTAATSNATNNVADVVNATGTVSGNQTNVAFCGGAFVPPSPPSTTYRGTGDVASASPSATQFWGTGAYTQWQVTGTYLALNVVRTGSDNHGCDVLLNTSGNLGNTINCRLPGGALNPSDNGQAIATWCSTNCVVAEAYDQSAIFNGNIAANVAQPTLANAPKLAFNCVTNVPACITFNGTTQTLLGWYINASASLSAAMVFDPTNTGLSTSVIYNGNTQWGVNFGVGNVFNGGNNSLGTISANQEHAMNVSLYASGAGNLDGSPTSLTGSASGGGTNVVSLAQVNFSRYFPGNIVEAGLWNGTGIPAASLNLMCRNQQSRYGASNFGATC